MIQSDNGGEFSNIKFKQFLLKQNIDQKFGPPYQPKCQGAVESRNKTIQKFLKMAKYDKKDKYDLEDCVNHFLICYNNRKHSTTGIGPYITVFSKKLTLFQKNFELFQKKLKLFQKNFVPFQKNFELIKKNYEQIINIFSA